MSNKVGEFELIGRIAAQFRDAACNPQPSSCHSERTCHSERHCHSEPSSCHSEYSEESLPPGIVGIGDDCAVLPQRDGTDTLVTTDLLIEDRHFLLSDVSPYALGWKSAAVNISDIAAMGGKPVATFLSIALPKSLPCQPASCYHESSFVASAPQDDRDVSSLQDDAFSSGSMSPMVQTSAPLGAKKAENDPNGTSPGTIGSTNDNGVATVPQENGITPAPQDGRDVSALQDDAFSSGSMSPMVQASAPLGAKKAENDSNGTSPGTIGNANDGSFASAPQDDRDAPSPSGRPERSEGAVAGWVDQFIEGYKALCGRFGVPLLGGDTSASPDKLFINVTVLGECPHGRAVLRSGAVAGDLICVTGPLGDSAGGLRLILERSAAAVFPTVPTGAPSGAKKAENDPNGTSLGTPRSTDGPSEALIRRHYLPMPRVQEGQALRDCPGVHAMMDISDGIASDLRHILKASGGIGKSFVASAPQDGRDVSSLQDDACSSGSMSPMVQTWAPLGAKKAENDPNGTSPGTIGNANDGSFAPAPQDDRDVSALQDDAFSSGSMSPMVQALAPLGAKKAENDPNGTSLGTIGNANDGSFASAPQDDSFASAPQDGRDVSALQDDAFSSGSMSPMVQASAPLGAKKAENDPNGTSPGTIGNANDGSFASAPQDGRDVSDLKDDALSSASMSPMVQTLAPLGAKKAENDPNGTSPGTIGNANDGSFAPAPQDNRDAPSPSGRPERSEGAGTLGAEIDISALPLSEELKEVCAERGWDAAELAVSGGEDYELLVTLAPETLEAAREAVGGRLYVIGRIVEGGDGIRWIGGNKEYKGFTHF